MSAMFDYISGEKSGREAELKASLEHTAGHLGVELDEAAKLRAWIERLTAEIEGWKHTALAMRDAAIFWKQDGRDRSDDIQNIYFDAAMFGRWYGVYRGTCEQKGNE
jgi:hypothetical protein